MSCCCCCCGILMFTLTSLLLRPVPCFLQELTEEVVGSPIPEPRQRSRLFRSHSESSDEVSELDLSHGKKDAFVLEVFIYNNKYIYMQLIPRTSVTICSHFCRLMTLMPWRTSTPFSLMPLPPQVCSIHSLHSHYSTSSPTTHASVSYLLIESRLLQLSLFMRFIIPVLIFTFHSSGFYSCNTEIMPGIDNWTSGVQVLY